MSRPEHRARNQDRDETIELVEAAWPDGRIGELTTEAVRPPVEPDDPQSLARSRVVAALVALGLLGAGIVGVRSLGGSMADGLDGDSPGGGVAGLEAGSAIPPRLPGPDGYADLVADVREVSGSTKAFEVVLHPEFALVYLPRDERAARQDLWYWDGTIVGLESTGTSASQRFDLADVEPRVVVRLVERARRLVDGPTRSYALLRAPDGEGAAIWAYATNEYREGGFIAATPDGKVVRNTFRR